MGSHTLHWLLLLLTLTLCSSQGLETGDTSTGEDFPSLTDAVELLQIKEIVALNRRIAEKDIEIKKQEDEAQNLENTLSKQQEERESVIKQHSAEKEILEKELKGSKVLVRFMMNALHHSGEMMKEREAVIARQAEMVVKTQAVSSECKIENDSKSQLKFDSQVTILLQKENIDKLKNVLKHSGDLNASYSELEEIKSSEDACDLAAYVSSMSNVLSSQEHVTDDLKRFIENDKEIKDYLGSIKAEILKEFKTANQSDDQWAILDSYKSMIKKQSTIIRHMSTIASYGDNMTADFRFEEDNAGNLVSASSCQCLPEIQNQLSVVLGSQDQKIVSMWSPWQYQDCFEWVKADNSTSDCGLHGKKVRHRVKELDSDTWEEETEEEACGECKVPGIQVGDWSEWSECEEESQGRWRLEMTGYGVKTQEETQECIDFEPVIVTESTSLEVPLRRNKKLGIFIVGGGGGADSGESGSSGFFKYQKMDFLTHIKSNSIQVRIDIGTGGASGGRDGRETVVTVDGQDIRARGGGGSANNGWSGGSSEKGGYNGGNGQSKSNGNGESLPDVCGNQIVLTPGATGTYDGDGTGGGGVIINDQKPSKRYSRDGEGYGAGGGEDDHKGYDGVAVIMLCD